jgi:hypothetical protein
MYVNELTCDYGDEGRQAVRELLRRAEALGAYDEPVELAFRHKHETDQSFYDLTVRLLQPDARRASLIERLYAEVPDADVLLIGTEKDRVCDADRSRRNMMQRIDSLQSCTR